MPSIDPPHDGVRRARARPAHAARLPSRRKASAPCFVSTIGVLPLFRCRALMEHGMVMISSMIPHDRCKARPPSTISLQPEGYRCAWGRAENAIRRMQAESICAGTLSPAAMRAQAYLWTPFGAVTPDASCTLAPPLLSRPDPLHTMQAASITRLSAVCEPHGRAVSM
jgi:hypothetical protein